MQRRGIALLDVIIGGVILSIGLGVAMSISARAMAQQRTGERLLVASWLADELLSMVVVEGPVAYPQLHDMGGRYDAPFDAYTFELSISDQGIGLPYEVEAHVSWPGSDGVRVQTLVSQRQGESIEPREPAETLDRDARWLELNAEEEA